MTLAELLVVLAILAITTTIAVQSMAPVASQAHYQATQLTLAALKIAIVGAPAGVNGPGTTSGFVADMGRLPRSLAEILSNPSNASIPQTFSPDQDSSASASTVTVVSGWKGPYLTTPVGQTTATVITDSWGRTINGPHSFTGTDWTVWSSGPNGVDDSTAAGMISGDDIPLIIQPTDYQATSITVTVAEISGGQLSAPTMATGDYVEVFLYTVNGGNVAYDDMTVANLQYDGLLGPRAGPIVQPTATAVITYNSSTSSSLTFSLYGSQAASSATSLTTPSFNFTFSPTVTASSGSLPVILNVGTIVVQAAHCSSSNSTVTIKTRSVPLVASLTQRAALNPTLVMQ